MILNMDALVKMCISSASALISSIARYDIEEESNEVRQCTSSSPAHVPVAFSPSHSSPLSAPCYPATPSHCLTSITHDGCYLRGSRALAAPPLPKGTACQSLVTSTEPVTPFVGSPMSLKDDPWMRPLGYSERFMTRASNYGCMITSYCLWLESTVPIDLSIIKKAASIVFRKMPHLRLCIGIHQNDKWWREMPREVLDVKEVQTRDIVKTAELVLQHRFNVFEGPLWLLRFITHPDSGGLERDTNFNLKHKSVCVFGFHHNISDGTTNMKLSHIFLSVLNDLLDSKEISIQEEGRFAAPLHDRIGEQLASRLCLLRIYLGHWYKGIISYGAFVRNFTGLYPMPIESVGRTRVLSKELNEIITDRLLKRCKMEGVTLHSAFTAAANIGVFKLIQQRNKFVTNTDVENVHVINMRRYWPKEERPNSFGCHISLLDLRIPATAEDVDNFWEYSRKCHEVLSYKLNVEKRALRQQPLGEKLWLAIFFNTWLNWLCLPTANYHHYCVTNMGDLNSTFPGYGNKVEVTKVLRSVSCHFMPSLCQHTLQTFRGKFYYSLDYYEHNMSRETAATYVTFLIDTLVKAIHTPN